MDKKARARSDSVLCARAQRSSFRGHDSRIVFVQSLCNFSQSLLCLERHVAEARGAVGGRCIACFVFNLGCVSTQHVLLCRSIHSLGFLGVERRLYEFLSLNPPLHRYMHKKVKQRLGLLWHAIRLPGVLEPTPVGSFFFLFFSVVFGRSSTLGSRDVVDGLFPCECRRVRLWYDSAIVRGWCWLSGLSGSPRRGKESGVSCNSLYLRHTDTREVGTAVLIKRMNGAVMFIRSIYYRGHLTILLFGGSLHLRSSFRRARYLPRTFKSCAG